MVDTTLAARLDALPRHPVPWTDGTWTREPTGQRLDGDALLASAAEGSDAWCTTGYGFVHDDAHALLAPLPDGAAVEVSFLADFDGQFDQAGVFSSLGPRTWLKAGFEFSDGELGIGAVATREVSDWSWAPVPRWAGREVTVRVSRRGDALTVRARPAGEPFRFVRLTPIDPAADVQAGPFLAAPTRPDLTVRFTSWCRTDADDAIH